MDGNHVYERDVEFSEYYELYKSEREKYPIISKISYYLKLYLNQYFLIEF